jgi:hypothetical protein
MTGAGADNEDLAMARMTIDEEMMGYVGTCKPLCSAGRPGLRQETAKQSSSTRFL